MIPTRSGTCSRYNTTPTYIFTACICGSIVQLGAPSRNFPSVLAGIERIIGRSFAPQILRFWSNYLQITKACRPRASAIYPSYSVLRSRTSLTPPSPSASWGEMPRNRGSSPLTLSALLRNFTSSRAVTQGKCCDSRRRHPGIKPCGLSTLFILTTTYSCVSTPLTV